MLAFESQNVRLTESKGRPILFNFLTSFKVLFEIFGGSRGVKGAMEYFLRGTEGIMGKFQNAKVCGKAQRFYSPLKLTIKQRDIRSRMEKHVPVLSALGRCRCKYYKFWFVTLRLLMQLTIFCTFYDLLVDLTDSVVVVTSVGFAVVISLVVSIVVVSSVDSSSNLVKK